MNEIQFDPKIHGVIGPSGRRLTDMDEIRGVFGAVEGFNIKRPLRRRKKCPEWARTTSGITATLLGTKGLLRFRIAYLFWLCGHSVPEVSAILNKNENYIRLIINRLRKKKGEKVSKLIPLQTPIGESDDGKTN